MQLVVKLKYAKQFDRKMTKNHFGKKIKTLTFT